MSFDSSYLLRSFVDFEFVLQQSREEKKILAYERAFEQMERAQQRQTLMHNAKQRDGAGDDHADDSKETAGKKRQRSADDVDKKAGKAKVKRYLLGCVFLVLIITLRQISSNRQRDSQIF